MTKEQFVDAMAIIGTGGACTVKTTNDAGHTKAPEDARYGIHITYCPPRVIMKLQKGGFMVGMQASELYLTYLGGDQS